MKMFRLLFLLLGLAIYSISCYKEQVNFAPSPDDELELPLIIAFDDKNCFYDEKSNNLRYSIEEDSIVDFSPFVEFQEYSTISINGMPLTNHTTNDLGTIKIKETYSLRIVTQGESQDFTLSFTTLPVIRIVTQNKIQDEPQSIARLTINYPDSDLDLLTSLIGIDYRGSSSQKNPKKSYGFSFLEDLNENNKVSKEFFDWEENEDWILDAVYKDQAKFRNKISFEIWEDMNPSDHVAIQSEFVEVYLNNDYQGLYCLNEQINAEKLDLECSDAFLYKTIAWSSDTYFHSLSSNSFPNYSDLWDGWEQKYPYPTEEIEWEPLYDLRNWIVNSTDDQFATNLSVHIDLENIINYYLFINLVGAHDNHGKNIFWLKYHPSDPFSIVPWDLDASWGRDFDAQPLLPILPKVEDSNFFKRLLVLNPDNFKSRLQDKWNNLRANDWSNIEIEERLDEHFEQLIKNGVIELENNAWGTRVDLHQERIFLRNWMTDNFNRLDLHISTL